VPEYEKPQNIRELATRLSDLGYWPVPIPAGCKGPVVENWQSLRLNFETIPNYFTERGMLVGILHVNVLALDIDVYDEELSQAIVTEALRRFPGALERIGEAPKSALFLRMEEPGFKVRATKKRERDEKTAQVDVRSATRQIVAYGKHPSTGKPYTWPRGELWETPWGDLPEATQDEIERFRDWCEDRIAKWAGVSDPKVTDIGLYPRSSPSGDDKNEPQFLEALKHIPASIGYDDWLSALMGIHDFYEGSAHGLDVAQSWSSDYPHYDPKEVEQKWRSFEVGKGVSFRTVFALARQNGADLSAIAKAHVAKSISLESPTVATHQTETEASTASAQADQDDNWKRGLIVNSRGRAVFNTANALLVLENHPDLKGCFAYDEFRQVKLVTKPLPGSSAPRATFRGRDFRDSDTIRVVAHFNRNGFPDASKSVLADAIEAIAEQSAFHPVRNYLNDLPEWDGVGRIDEWLMTFCNVQPASDAEAAYVREVGAKWLISAVARVMRPGCKADGVLILEGAQGARKSTTLRNLAGEDWFGDSLPPMTSKDASDYLRGKWIIEMAELSNINKAEVEVVKAFISRESERFRPAYARTPRESRPIETRSGLRPCTDIGLASLGGFPMRARKSPRSSKSIEFRKTLGKATLQAFALENTRFRRQRSACLGFKLNLAALIERQPIGLQRYWQLWAMSAADSSRVGQTKAALDT